MIERIPIKQNPVLFDKYIGMMQTQLAQNLAWLTHSFGKAERLVKILPNGKKYFTPNVYVGKNNYELLAPDKGFGNYSFFVLDEPQEVEYNRGVRTIYRTPFSIIFWFNMRTLENQDERNTERIKQEILRTLNGKIFVRGLHYTINRIYEKAENIYYGFTLDEVDNQFLMHPYAGFRFSGEMQITDDCEL